MKTSGRRAVLLERDGVLCERVELVSRPEHFLWRPDAIEALHALAQAGWHLVVTTQQPDIARGRIGPAEYDNLTGWMQASLAAAGVRLEGVYHCPHLPDAPLAAWCRHCDCRTPQPGLLRRAARDLKLDLADCVVIGDQAAAIAAGRAAHVAACVRIGPPPVLLPPGADTPRAPDTTPAADFTCAGLGQAAEWLLGHERRRHA